MKIKTGALFPVKFGIDFRQTKGNVCMHKVTFDVDKILASHSHKLRSQTSVKSCIS